jgi:hypothetical protein
MGGLVSSRASEQVDGSAKGREDGRMERWMDQFVVKTCFTNTRVQWHTAVLTITLVPHVLYFLSDIYATGWLYDTPHLWQEGVQLHDKLRKKSYAFQQHFICIFKRKN